MDLLDHQNIRLVVFDLDGTLVDSDEAISMCFNRALTEMGYPCRPVADIARLIGLPLMDMFAHYIDGSAAEQAVERYRSHYRTICVEKTTVLPCVTDTLEFLLGRGCTLAVASNKPLRFTQDILRATSLKRYFSLVAGPEDVEIPKPDPAMLLHVMRNLGMEGSETIYVGDSLTDCRTAQAASVRMFAVATGSHTQAELEAAGSDWVSDSLCQFQEYLTKEGEGASWRSKE